MSRYQLDGLVSRHVRGAFPWGTLVVNVSGCFVLGLLFTVLTERFLPHPDLRSALTIGFQGAYTTRARQVGSGAPAPPNRASPLICVVAETG